MFKNDIRFVNGLFLIAGLIFFLLFGCGSILSLEGGGWILLAAAFFVVALWTFVIIKRGGFPPV